MLLVAGCSEGSDSTTSQPQATTGVGGLGASSTTSGERSPVPSSAPAATLPNVTRSEGLTREQVSNAEITVGFEEHLQRIHLVDGSYEGPSGDGLSRVRVVVTEVAFGDLDGDDVGDVALGIRVGRIAGVGSNAVGGSDGAYPEGALIYEYVVGLLSQGQAPHQVGYHPVGPGARIEALSIVEGEILLEALVPEPEDPGGDATVRLKATLSLPLNPGGTWLLLHTSQTSVAPGGDERTITITSPEPGDTMLVTGVIAGNVSVAPFENTLVYRVYDMEMIERAVGPVTVEAPDMGAPGTFELVIDLTSLGCWGEIFVTISDESAVDGSILAMDSIRLFNDAPG